MKKHVNEWKSEVHIFLESKQKEFQLIGYEDVTIDQLWSCLHTFCWKEIQHLQLHEVVQHILQLTNEDYMNYLRLLAMKADKTDMFASIQSLLGPRD